MQKRLMVIDSLNLFVRNFIVDPSVATNGNPLGGVQGSLRSIQKLIRIIKPDEIVMAWDGPNGSSKRRAIHKEYKDGRKPVVRLNRSGDLTEAQESDNKIWQQFRLFDYLNQVPVIQLLEENIEADDLIAFVVRCTKYDDWHKVIVSSDKDFLQLMDKDTFLYRPIVEKIETWKTVITQFGIHPCNFALARSIAGDTSDNIKGIGGVGLKTVAKNLPMLGEDKTYLIDEIEEICNKKIEEKTKLKFFQTFIDNIDAVKQNYSITQLYSPNISIQTANKIRFATDNFTPELNLTKIQTMMIEDGFSKNINFDEMNAIFRRFVKDYQESKDENK